MKNYAIRRVIAFIIVLSVMLPVLPAVFSEDATSVDAPLAADRLWDQIDSLRHSVQKRGVSAGEAAYASLSDKVYDLVSASGTAVEGSLFANGDFIKWIDSETGIPCCYSPAHEAEQSASCEEPASDTRTLTLDTLPQYSLSSSNCPQSLNVGLLQPFWESNSNYYDAGFTRYSTFFLQQANKLAETTGGNVIRFSMGDVTPDTIAYTLQNCGMVIINCHGGTDYSNNGDHTSRANCSYLWLTSGGGSIEGMKALLYPEDYKTTHIGTYGTYSDVYYSGSTYCISGNVIANHMTADAPSSMFYIGCCLGMATDGLFAPLLAKGVKVAFGFTQSITFKGDYAYMLSMTASLANGNTINTAIADAKQEVGLRDPYMISRPAYPIAVSSEDIYPGQGNVDAPQTVHSTWHLSKYCVNFSVPPSTTQIPSVYLGEDDSVTLPCADDIDGYNFVGWSLVPIIEMTDAPTILQLDETYIPSSHSMLYAVYQRTSVQSGGYVKVTSEPSAWNGKYLLVKEDGTAAFNASLATTSQDFNTSHNYITVEAVNNQISPSVEVEAAAVTINRISGTPYYSIKLPCNKYLGNSGAGARINVNGDTPYENSITFDGDKQTVTITTKGTAYSFLFNPGQNNDRFSFYDPGGKDLQSVCLYKKDINTSVHSYTTVPIISGCTHSSYRTTVTSANCLSGGYSTRTCNNCGMSWTFNYTKPLGHMFDKGVTTEASQGVFGCTAYTCRRTGCGYSYETDFSGLDYQVTLSVFGSAWETVTVNSYDGAILPDPIASADGYSFAGWSEVPIASESAAADLITDLYYPMEDATLYAVFERCVDHVIFYSTTQKELKIHSASLILNGKTDIAFTAQLPDGYSDARMVVNGTEIADDGTHVFVYSGINPQCIGDSITATLYATKDGSEESVSIENYSVRQYCVHKLADGSISDALRTLLSDLLAYGEAAQLYMNYKTDSLVTDGDDISNPMYSFPSIITGYRASFDGTPDESVCWVETSLTLTDSVAMMFRFRAESTENLSVTITINGRSQTFTEFTSIGGDIYEVSFTGISAEEFADTVTASFSRNDAQIGNTVSYSVNSYVQSKMNSEDDNLAYLVMSLYSFGASAAAYANSSME